MRILNEKENPYSSVYANDGNKWWVLTTIYYSRFNRHSWRKTDRPKNSSNLQDVTYSWADIFPMVTKNIEKERHIALLNLF